MEIENYFDFSSNFSSGTSAILSKKEIIPKEIQHNEKVFLFSNMFNFKTNKITIPSQTHSDNCQIVKKNGSYLDTDGLITDNLNLILSLSVADCCPIYIEDTRNNSIGLIHSGWKGTANKIVLNAVNIFIENGSNIKDLTRVLSEKKNNILNLKVIKSDNSIREYNIKLVENKDNIKIGITALPTTYLNQILETYKTNYFTNPLIHFIPPTLAQGVIPFSDELNPFYETSLGPMFHPLTNTLYWIWFININLAIFNSLPLLPLDGGHALRNVMKNTIGKRFGEKISNRITYLVTLTMIIIILLLVLIPYII